MPEWFALLIMSVAFLAVIIVPAFLFASTICFFTGNEKVSLAVFFIMLILCTVLVLKMYTDFVMDMNIIREKPGDIVILPAISQPQFGISGERCLWRLKVVNAPFFNAQPQRRYSQYAAGPKVP